MESQAIERTANDGTKLHLHHFAADRPKAQVVLLHGYGEHAARYAELAATLVGAGYDVVAPDQRGHGLSGGARAYCDRFTQYLDDVDLVLAEADKTAPGVPRFFIGHSFGGLVSLRYIETRGPRLAGVVLSSPFLRIKLAVPAWKIAAAKLASKLHPHLTLPSGLAGAEVTRDPEIAARYDADPLNAKGATARWYIESMAAQDAAFADAGRVTVPVLLMHGEADRVADPARSAELFPRLSSTDKTLELITGAYHEIFNEPPAERKKIMARTVSWLDAHLS